MFELNSKAAPVTGAGQNMGAGIARLLGLQGAAVAVNDYHLDRAQRTANPIVESGGQAQVFAF